MKLKFAKAKTGKKKVHILHSVVKSYSICGFATRFRKLPASREEFDDKPCSSCKKKLEEIEKCIVLNAQPTDHTKGNQSQKAEVIKGK